MNNLFDLQNKTILITGSTGGLGKTFAEALAESGATIIINGRNKEKLRKTLEEFSERNFKVFGYAFDISNENEVKKAAAGIKKEPGMPHVLVNNAGIQKRAPLEDFNVNDWNQLLSINLTGAFIVAKTFVKEMIKRKEGKIINICSVQSELGRASIAPYTASKGGLKMLTRGMAADWAKYNIQVNAIGPGYYKTELTRALYEDRDFDEWLCKRTPAERWGNPEELAGTLIYLSSEASSYVNGQIIYVDGGITASI